MLSYRLGPAGDASLLAAILVEDFLPAYHKLCSLFAVRCHILVVTNAIG